MDISSAVFIYGAIVIITFIVLSIFIIYSLTSLTRFFRDVIRTLNQISVELSESLRNIDTNVQKLTTKTIDSLDKFDKASESVISSAKDIENDIKRTLNIFTPLEELVNSVYNRLAPPINQVSLLLSASSKAVNTFINLFAGGKKNK